MCFLGQLKNLGAIGKITAAPAGGGGMAASPKDVKLDSISFP
jgi:hypothetical protein